MRFRFLVRLIYHGSMTRQTFSSELDNWLKKSKNRTLFGLSEVFEEKSFAILIMLLMFPSSLPIPTGGITNFFEIIVMLLCLELILGHDAIWLPKRWGNRKVGKMIETRAVPFISRRIRWFERFSRPRLSGLLSHKVFLRITGVILLVFTVGAFISPPFLGLDTLPSMGAVIVSLAIILDDFAIFVFGCLIGIGGIGLIIGLSELVVRYLQNFI